ncbi:MAG: ribbon-helix-helix domain-containing protein [Chloroflexi bacterium]|jgi:hypothetical protein|nr:ribbon-helix-helix domain-containing protein [Chloroflexota bacterium]
MTLRRTTILADPDLLERVDRLARRRQTTKTAVITQALEAFLADADDDPRPSFVAIGRSGHGRLSLDGRSIVRRELGGRRRADGPAG